MLSEQNYIKILSYFDKQFWQGKTTETNWNYYGLVLDWYFENSVLCIDYLDVADYFECNGGFSFADDKYLSEQYENISINKRLLVLQNILNILKHSVADKEHSNQIIESISNVLKRNNVKVINPDTGYIVIMPDDIFDSGSYCNIVRVNDGVLRKELKNIYKSDVKLKKRLKYEYENMQKLSDCPQILHVYDYEEENDSYLMEQGEVNLYKYLNEELGLSFNDKLKIIMDVLKEIYFAHEHSIIHRDLHLGNILKIGKDFVLCDFGLSKDLSIERSMKSSYTAKNNHLFVDPLAISDFTKLDLKSDIYSIGKIIDYIFTFSGDNANHIFKTVVERCICRDKDLRYGSVQLIIKDIEVILKNQGQQEEREDTINKILNNKYDAGVHEYVLDLVDTDRLCKFIVTHKLSSFDEIVIKFENVYQEKILNCISAGYIEATGYGGWSNYDIFARITYNLCLSLKEIGTKKISKSILEGCAERRYTARNLYEGLPD